MISHLNKEHKPFATRLRELLDRYRVQASISLAILTALTLLASEIFPKVQEFVFHSGVLQYVTLMVVLDLAVSVYLRQAPPIIQLAKNQDESLSHLVGSIPHCRAEGADLLEFAGATTLPLIRAIQRERVQLRMLVKHPETVGGLQKQRMIATLDTIYNSIFEHNNNGFEIRCYRAPFTLRARRLGSEVLELGWLTPDLKNHTAFGHANPCLIADLSTRSNDYLRAFFDKTFDDLWTSEDTEDGRAVLNRLKPVAEAAAAASNSPGANH